MRSGIIRSLTEPKFKGDYELFRLEVKEAMTDVPIVLPDGDRDGIYELRAYLVNGYAGSLGPFIRFNDDVGNNYGIQFLGASGGSVTAGRTTASTSHDLNSLASGTSGIYQLTFEMKNGVIRPATSTQIDAITGTTVNRISILGYIYNEAVKKIAKITFSVNQTGGIAPGSVFVLNKKVIK